MLSKRFLTEIALTSKLAAPVSAMFLANMAMQIVDTFFVGKLGPEALGGLSIAVAVFNVCMVVGMGLLLGLDFLVSKAFGEKNPGRCQHLLEQGAFLAFAASLPLIACMNILPLGFERFGLPPAISATATLFIRPLSWSLLPFLLLNAFRMYLQGQGNVKAAFYVVVAANLLNLALNPLLIFGRWGLPPLGVQGSALATLIGRWFSFFLIAVLAHFHHKKKIRPPSKRGMRGFFRPSWQTQKNLLRLGTPAAGQLLLEVGTFALITFLIGRLAPVELAAHQIVLHMASLTFMVPLGISVAAAVRVGHTVGRRHRHRVQLVGWSALFLSFMIMSACAAGLYGFSDPLLHFFTRDGEVIEIGKKLLFIAALFQISDGFQVTAAGALRGIGDTKASLWANFAGHWLLGLPLGAFLCLGSPGLRAQGAWIGLSVGLTTVAVLLTATWARKSNAGRSGARIALKDEMGKIPVG